MITTDLLEPPESPLLVNDVLVPLPLRLDEEPEVRLAVDPDVLVLLRLAAVYVVPVPLRLDVGPRVVDPDVPEPL